MNGSLLSLKVYWNDFGDSGAMHLASALGVNISLQFLDFRWNGIGVPGLSALRDAMRRNSLHRIRSLRLHGKHSTETSVLLQAIARLTRLRRPASVAATAAAPAIFAPDTSMQDRPVSGSLIGGRTPRGTGTLLRIPSGLRALDPVLVMDEAGQEPDTVKSAGAAAGGRDGLDAALPPVRSVSAITPGSAAAAAAPAAIAAGYDSDLDEADEQAILRIPFTRRSVASNLAGLGADRAPSRAASGGAHTEDDHAMNGIAPHIVAPLPGETSVDSSPSPSPPGSPLVATGLSRKVSEADSADHKANHELSGSAAPAGHHFRAISSTMSYLARESALLRLSLIHI